MTLSTSGWICWATQWASKGHPGCTGVHQEKGRKLCHCWQLHERETLCGLHLQFPLSVCHCCATYFENRPSQSNNTLPHPETTELSLRNSFIIPSPHATPRGAHHQDLKHNIYIYGWKQGLGKVASGASCTFYIFLCVQQNWYFGQVQLRYPLTVSDIRTFMLHSMPFSGCKISAGKSSVQMKLRRCLGLPCLNPLVTKSFNVFTCKNLDDI